MKTFAVIFVLLFQYSTIIAAKTEDNLLFPKVQKIKAFRNISFRVHAQYELFNYNYSQLPLSSILDKYGWKYNFRNKIPFLFQVENIMGRRNQWELYLGTVLGHVYVSNPTPLQKFYTIMYFSGSPKPFVNTYYTGIRYMLYNRLFSNKIRIRVPLNTMIECSNYNLYNSEFRFTRRITDIRWVQGIVLESSYLLSDVLSVGTELNAYTYFMNSHEFSISQSKALLGTGIFMSVFCRMRISKG